MQSGIDVTAGVIEGLFGTPWSWPARSSGADLQQGSGCQLYIYAPKADPFRRQRGTDTRGDAVSVREAGRSLPQLRNIIWDRTYAF